MTRSQFSSVISMNGWKSVMPALLTRICTGPNSACTRSTAALTCARFDTSTRLAIAFAPAAISSAAARFAPSSLMSQMATLAPSRAKR